MNYFEFNSEFKLVTPTGTIFLERLATSTIQLCHMSNQIYDRPPELVLANRITDKKVSLVLQLETVEETRVYQIVEKLDGYDCGVYDILYKNEPIATFTLSPQFTDVQMCTVYSHQISSILDKINKLPYNWLHLTPLPKSGPSKSCYSMNGFSDYVLSSSQIEQLKNKKILVDVVLNHLAPTAKELIHINNTYNNINRPDLKPAAIFDFHLQILNHYSQGREHKDIMADVERILDEIKIYEFELIDKKQTKWQMVWNKDIINYDMTKAAILNGKRIGGKLNEEFLKQSNIDKSMHSTILNQYNRHVQDRYNQERAEMLRNLSGGLQYQISQRSKYLFTNYFCVVTDAKGSSNINQEFYKDFRARLEKSKTYDEFVKNNQDLLQKIEDDQYVLAANNGWVMGAAIKFVDPVYRIYNQRKLIAWGDCVKLNYDNNDELRQLAIQYVGEMAKHFQGLRIDNAHSTDESLLQSCLYNARKLNNSLLVMLEIFTGSQDRDSSFTQNVSGDLIVKEMVHYDSVDKLCALPTFLSINNGLNVIGDFEPIYRKQLCKGAPVMLFDFTHDNAPCGSNDQCHGIGQALAFAAITVASEGIASSTTYGTDLGIWRHILVTNQTPCYKDFDKFGMTQIRQEFLRLKMELISYTKVYAHNHGNFMTVERMNPDTLESYIFIIMPDFRHWYTESVHITCEGTYDSIRLHARLKCRQDHATAIKYEDMELHDVCELDTANTNLSVEQTDSFHFNVQAQIQPGEVIVLKKTMPQVGKYVRESIVGAVQSMTKDFEKFQIVQWKCFCAMTEAEDRYYGIEPYSFEGIHPTISSFDGLRDCVLRTRNSESVAQNIRTGNWMLDYFVERNRRLGLDLPTIQALVNELKDSIPNSFKPLAAYYLFKAIDGVVDQVLMKQYGYSSQLETKLMRAGLLVTGFLPMECNVDESKWLTLATREQLIAQIKMAKGDTQVSVETLETQAKHRTGRTRRGIQLMWKKTEGEKNESEDRLLNVSIAAGYPHFISGMFRSWGRDIFLSVAGLLFKQSQIASKIIIISTASMLRHGLLPNLQDSGRKPRYNCRDAIWYWMATLSQYIQVYGPDILNMTVKRIFPSDNEEDYNFDEQNYTFVMNNGTVLEQTIADVCREAFKKHYDGIAFWEWACQDNDMKPQGKEVKAWVDHETGIVYGGNKYNCHTWMDKMGGSDEFGNKGVPSTSRHGAAIEINLCCLFSLEILKDHLKDSYIAEWHSKLKKSIMQFKIQKGDLKYLRDCLDSEEFRPNYLIGLSYFDKKWLQENFKEELKSAYNVLLEPNSIAMKTLAPFDPRYVSWYNNNDRTSYATAKGFSYHNGPEWVHPLGKSMLAWKKIEAQNLMDSRMINIGHHIYYGRYVNGDVKSLPELTQGNGGLCWDSCNSQAWAIGCVLEAIAYK